MAQQRDLTGTDSLNEANDEEVLFGPLTTNQPSAGTVLDLTGQTLEAFLKPTAGSPDVDGWKGTIAGGQVIVNTPSTAGTGSILIPASAITTSMAWWRLDVISSGGKRKTALYGRVSVTDL